MYVHANEVCKKTVMLIIERERVFVRPYSLGQTKSTFPLRTSSHPPPIEGRLLAKNISLCYYVQVNSNNLEAHYA